MDALDERQLNRTVLLRQMLIERAATTIPEALEKMGGLQAQYAPSSYIGLWSRVEGFRRQDLNDVLESRSVIQGTLMRTTIHLVSAGDYWLFAAALRQPRRDWFLRVTRPAVSPEWMEEKARRTRELLAGGPLKRSVLVKELDLASHLWVGVGLWVDLVRVPPSGTWEHRRADLYGLAESWIAPSDPSPEQGTDHLVARYLRAFGPANQSDILSWSSLPGPSVNDSLARLDLRTYEDEAGQDPLRPPRRPPGGRRYARSVTPAGNLGRGAAGARPADADTARSLPAPGLSHQESAVGLHLHSRRTGGGELEVCRQIRVDRALRAPAGGELEEVQQEGEKMAAALG